MKGKQIIIAFCVLALLSLYLYFFGIKKKQDAQKAKDESAVIFPGMSADAITGITIKTKDMKIVMKKSENSWDLTLPVKAPADKTLAESITSGFAGAKAERKIEAALLADYNLNTPPVYAEFLQSGGRTETLYMSDLNPTGAFAYAYKQGDNSSVYMVAKTLRDFCDKTLKDFRYKGLLRGAEQAATKIEVNLKDKKYTLEKQGGLWQVVSPVNKPAKNERVSSIINNMQNSSLKEFLAASSAAQHGLISPVEYVKIYEGNNVSVVYFGSHDAKNSSVFAKSSLQDGVVEMPEYIYAGIARLDEVLNRQIMTFSQEQARKVSIKYGDKSVEAERNKPGKRPDWIIKKAAGIKDKDKKTMNIYTIINAVSAAEYIKEILNTDKVKEASEYGLSPASAEIIIMDTTGKNIGVLLVGKKTGTNEIYVKVPEQNKVYTVLESTITGMSLPGAGFKIDF